MHFSSCNSLAFRLFAIVCLCGLIPTANAALVVTEVMYHAAPDGAIPADSLDFIEFHNNGATDVDLSNVFFAEGLNYSFPNGTMLAPGNYIVLVNSLPEFQMKYLATGVFDEYGGQLRNSGERLTIVDGTDTLINFRYNDNLPWPVLADGNGWSIVPVDASAANSSSASDWRASTDKCGSPGLADPTPTSWPAILVNEVLPHTDLPDPDAIELYNASNQTVDISGWWLTDDRNTPKKYKIPNGTTMAPGDYFVFTEVDWDTGAIPFVLNRVGEWAFVFSADASEELTGYVHGWDQR